MAAEESAVLVLLVARAGEMEIPLSVGGAAPGIVVSGVGTAVRVSGMETAQSE